MVTFVLDAIAAIRFLDGEAGAVRVGQIFASTQAGTSTTVISAVNWGEVINILAKRRGPTTADALGAGLVNLGLSFVSATAARAERAALLKLQYKIPYADAFGVELASDSQEHILVTADFDAKPAERLVRIEFLPTKSTP